MSEDIERAIGRLEARADSTEAWLKEIAADVKATRTTVDQARGGWKVLTAAATAGGALGALFTKFAGMLLVLPR